MQRFCAFLAVMSIVFVYVEPVQAQTFLDRAAFETALGIFQKETFESSTTTGGTTSFPFSGFAVTSGEPGLGIGTANNAGAHNTTPGGTNYLSSISLLPVTNVFTFDAPLLGFGVDITDIDNPGSVLLVDNGVGDSHSFPAGANGNELFVGFINTIPFSTVTFSFGSPGDSAYGIDDVTFTNVPEPSTAILFATTAACLIGYGWRRKRRLVG